MIYYDDIGHLISDKSLLELHQFASKIGLKREWFQDKHNGAFYYPHYDLTTDRAKRRAHLNGAKRVGPREIIQKLTDAPYQNTKPEAINNDETLEGNGL